MLLIGADGASAHNNHAAELMLKARDGVALARRRLVLSDAGAQQQLDEVLARIVGGAWSGKYRVGAEILAKRPSGGAAMVIVVTPLGVENPIAALATPVRCAVFVLEEKLRANGVLPDRLRRLYGLTPAETDIVIALAGGQSVAQTAKARGTVADTVRSQVKSALAKTGARRQADLVALVNRLRF